MKSGKGRTLEQRCSLISLLTLLLIILHFASHCLFLHISWNLKHTFYSVLFHLAYHVFVLISSLFFSTLHQWISGSWNRRWKAVELQNHRRREGMHYFHFVFFHTANQSWAEHTVAESEPAAWAKRQLRDNWETTERQLRDNWETTRSHMSSTDQLPTVCRVGLLHIHNFNTVRAGQHREDTDQTLSPKCKKEHKTSGVYTVLCFYLLCKLPKTEM